MNIAMEAENFIAVNYFIDNLDFDGNEVLRIIKDPKIETFEPSFAGRAGIRQRLPWHCILHR